MYTSSPSRKDSTPLLNAHVGMKKHPDAPLPRISVNDLDLRVVICEDHDLSRIAFREICSKIGCQVVAETDKGAEAIELVDHYKPDMLILDMLLRDDIPGQQVHREIRLRGLNTKVFVVTMYGDSASFFEWIKQPDGPDGVLEKDTSAYELRTGFIQVLTTGEKYIPDHIWCKEVGDRTNPLCKLAPHELNVLRDVAVGMRLVDIAANQHLSASTVRSYMNDVYRKLGLAIHSLQAAGAEYHKWVGVTGQGIPTSPSSEQL